MKKPTIFLVPQGGLANRMRSILSAYQLAREIGSRLEVVWFKDKGLNAGFHDLFLPVKAEGFHLRDACGLDFLRLQLPKGRNLHLTRLVQKGRFDVCLYETCTPVAGTPEELKAQLQGRQVYWATCYAHQAYPADMAARFFRPLPAIEKKVEQFSAQLGPVSMGVHIRRTDNAQAIEHSPIRLFFDRIDSFLAHQPEGCIFLATDDQDTKKAMRQRYGQQLVCVPQPASRKTLSGVVDGLVDMLTLARCGQILGSWYSSFSELAAQIGGVPLEIVKKES